MTFITRSLPLNLDILLLGVVEPPDRELNPRIGPGKTSGRDLGLRSITQSDLLLSNGTPRLLFEGQPTATNSILSLAALKMIPSCLRLLISTIASLACQG